MTPRRPIAFKRIADTALRHADTIVRRWLPDGMREGGEWVSLNPTRSDRRRGSFKVNLASGRWSDFATGDAGGDLVSLGPIFSGSARPKRLCGSLKCGKSTAMSADQFAPIRSAAQGSRRKAQAWTPILPVPGNAPELPRHPDLGTPSGTYPYRDVNGALLGYVLRFDPPSGKEFRPCTFCRHPNGTLTEWRADMAGQASDLQSGQDPI